MSTATFDRVSFSAGRASWTALTAEQMLNELGCLETELETSSLSVPRIFSEVQRVRQLIDPFLGAPSWEDRDVIIRRDAIQSTRIDIDDLKSLVASGASESILQKTLKRDLSIFADCYARPSEEYICFAEFPLADGFVDFVLFSGTSRMDVTLIEVKGADFELIKGNHYEDFSVRANEATKQLRGRIGYVVRNYEEFRTHVHEVRRVTLQGSSIKNTLVGPRGLNAVDPDKDVNIHCVAIAERGGTDVHGSRLRQDFESNRQPPIRVESWDTWLDRSSASRWGSLPPMLK